MKTEKRTVICGTDFSVHASEAAQVAAAIAKRLDATLALIHVAEELGLGAGQSQALDALLHRERERLSADAERLRSLGGTVSEELRFGSPYEVLVKAATESNARIVVVASIGRIAPGRLLAGSVAERTAETSPLPTLVVRQGSRLAAWARGERRLKVVVGYDFSASADAALGWLRELQGIGPCDITAVHVNWPPMEAQRLGWQGPISLTENPSIVETVLKRDLEERVAAILEPSAVSVRVIPGWGRPDAILIQVAQEEEADLLVVGTHQRHGLGRLWLGSISRSILHHASMSVAVVPNPGTGGGTLNRIPALKRVLVPTDFSELGNSAIRYSCAVLSRGGTVKLIHVIPPRELPGPLVPHYESKGERTEKEQQLPADSLTKLRSLIPPEADARGLSAEVEVIESRDEAKAIRQEAERFGADLIVIGSHGRSGLFKTVLGSVTQAVLAQSTRPVLIVRPAKP